ncbi:H-NS histone family protein [Chitinilyticum piscinae]|uniref:H-NS histone family protein n=1 Tax=Chitinilyticum piscinae TaxID=2866724 RepID=A0A8J7FK19_9NEIS|nr:H-NS histone family protein [Chitinilyticum piscinae]MBE9610593.1 H-NS histone family protein [Chitinilyticum piscinae]
MDLSGLNYNELVELRKRLDVELVRRKDQEKRQLLQDIEARASESGYTLAELLALAAGGKKAAAGKKTAGVAQFANPANPEQTWTGRGRKPQWVIDFLGNGGDIEALRIA